MTWNELKWYEMIWLYVMIMNFEIDWEMNNEMWFCVDVMRDGMMWNDMKWFKMIWNDVK